MKANNINGQKKKPCFTQKGIDGSIQLYYCMGSTRGPTSKLPHPGTSMYGRSKDHGRPWGLNTATRSLSIPITFWSLARAAKKVEGYRFVERINIMHLPLIISAIVSQRDFPIAELRKHYPQETIEAQINRAINRFKERFWKLNIFTKENPLFPPPPKKNPPLAFF